MKTSELTGAQLDYWVARAEALEPIIETYGEQKLCVIFCRNYSPSTDWAQGGPLAEKHDVFFEASNFPRMGAVFAYCGWRDIETGGGAYGSTRLQAICRAVVRSVFGDEVEDVK